MSLDRSKLRRHYSRKPDRVPVDLDFDGEYIEGLFVGDELQVMYNYHQGKRVSPQFAKDGIVRTAVVLHLLLTDADGFKQDLIGRYVTYQISGGAETLARWKHDSRKADICYGDTVCITRTATNLTTGAGVFEFEIEYATEQPSAELVYEAEVLRDAYVPRNELDAHIKKLQSFTS